MKYAALILMILVSTKSFAVGVCDDDQSLWDLWQRKYSAIVQSDSDSFSKKSNYLNS